MSNNLSIGAPSGLDFSSKTSKLGSSSGPHGASSLNIRKPPLPGYGSDYQSGLHHGSSNLHSRVEDSSSLPRNLNGSGQN